MKPDNKYSLVIRREQEDWMSKARYRQFKRRLVLLLKTIVTQRELDISGAQLGDQVELAIEQLRSCKLTRECDVARFMEIIYSTTADIEAVWQSREALSVLFDHRDLPDAKLERLRTWAVQQQLDNATNA